MSEKSLSTMSMTVIDVAALPVSSVVKALGRQSSVFEISSLTYPGLSSINSGAFTGSNTELAIDILFGELVGGFGYAFELRLAL